MNTSLTNGARLLAAGLRALLVLTVVTGIVYPLVVTGVAQGLFPAGPTARHPGPTARSSAPPSSASSTTSP
ncbi:Potassium-transporting ATPase KdpC subunit [Streptomyces tendae]